jgi:hypothetical protein
VTRALLSACALGPICALLAASGFAQVNAERQIRQISAKEEIRFGSSLGTGNAASAITGAAQLRSGAVALIAMTATGWALQVFSPEGALIWKRGFRIGESPMAVASFGDTIAVQAGIAENARVSLFVVGVDKPVRSVPVPSTGRDLGFVGAHNGTPILVDEPTKIGGGFAGGSDRAFGFRKVQSSGQVGPRFLTWIDSTVRPVVPHPRPELRSTITLILPWAAHPSFASSFSEIFTTDGQQYEITVYDHGGRFRRRIAIADPPHRISAELQSQWFARWRLGMVARLYGDSTVSAIQAFPFPSNRPVIGHLFADSSGALAVVREDLDSNPVAGADSARVDILDASAARIMRVSLPANAKVVAFAPPFLYATVTSDTNTAFTAEQKSRRRIELARYRITTDNRSNRREREDRSK